MTSSLTSLAFVVALEQGFSSEGLWHTVVLHDPFLWVLLPLAPVQGGEHLLLLLLGTKTSSILQTSDTHDCSLAVCALSNALRHSGEEEAGNVGLQGCAFQPDSSLRFVLCSQSRRGASGSSCC